MSFQGIDFEWLTQVCGAVSAGLTLVAAILQSDWRVLLLFAVVSISFAGVNVYLLKCAGNTSADTSPLLAAATAPQSDRDRRSIVRVGMFGGNGGSAFDIGEDARLLKIKIRHGVIVDAIKVEYERDGKTCWSDTFGGAGGTETEIEFSEDEYLVSVYGYYGAISMYNNLVLSLTFITNRGRVYGPFGSFGPQNGTMFSTPQDCRIVGFFGRSGLYLDAIGFYLIHNID